MKPGWQCSEFWLSVAAVAVGGLIASGALGENGTGAKVAGLIASALTALGYTGARLALKSKDEAPK